VRSSSAAAAGRVGLARLRRGLGDARDGEGQHPDGVGVAQQRRALAAQAQRGAHAPARQPDEAQRGGLDRGALRRALREQVVV
jgi:hypothetical protein